MLELLVIGLVGGLITGLSPCILPVLPVVFAGSAVNVPRVSSGPAVGDDEHHRDGGSAVLVQAPASVGVTARPFLIIAGLVVSFSVFTLAGTALLTALHLPQDLLRISGLAILAAVGLGLLIPRFGDALERPFARFPKRAVNRDGSAFVLGLGLGVLFVPCAGPVLTAITVVSASGQIGLSAVVLTVAFAVGAALPLLAFALAGDLAGKRVRAFREHANRVRQVSGVVLIATAVLLAFNITDRVQRLVPGYTDTLQSSLARNQGVQDQLRTVTQPDSVSSAAGELADCSDGATELQTCGPAPEITGITSWLNTPSGKPLSLAGLKGHVVLVDFWTYSCINCQRTIPHLQAWNSAYKGAGLVTIGVHTPEFSFERVPSNVESGAADLGVTWPIAIDNDFATWNAYDNRYWPAEYLIDARGVIRHVHFGEGEYAETEGLIRTLLSDAKSPAVLGNATSVPDQTPRNRAQTPESYLGYERMSNSANDAIRGDISSVYTVPDPLPRDSLAFGGSWTIGKQSAHAGDQARLVLHFDAKNVFLVLGGSGSIAVRVDGGPSRAFAVGGAPRLYKIVSDASAGTGTLTIDVPPGLDAYAFTFG